MSRVISYKGVYCNPRYEHEVNQVLVYLFERLQQEHPEYCFDVDGPDWMDDELDEGDCSEQQKLFLTKEDQ